MLFQTHTMAVWSWVMTVSRLLAFSLVMLMLAGCGGRAVLGLDARNVIKASAAVPAP
jgi:hypothetical protein